MRRLAALARVIDAATDAIGRRAAWLTLIVVAALFLQVPLREFVHFGYVTSNDLGQILHAAVIMIGVPYAMRWDAHVRADVFHQRMTRRRRAFVDLFGTLFFILPWLAVVGWFSIPIVVNSLRQLEAFPDTWTPGYFLIKTLLFVFILLVGLQALATIARAMLTLRRDDASPEADD